MSYKKPLLAAGAAVALSGLASAQTGPTQSEYDSNWAPNHDIGFDGIFSGPTLFGAFSGDGHFAGPGDAIRRCYGIDQTQGGRNNQGDGPPAILNTYETTWFKVIQGWDAANFRQGVDVGLVTVQGATDSDPGADPCLSPFFASTANTGGHELSAITIIGLLTGTAGGPFPVFWELGFHWAGSSVPGSATIGNDPTYVNVGVPGATHPLLVNVIFEVQGPLNGGPGNNQYYLASTTEIAGDGGGTANPGPLANGVPGGVANGLSAFGTSLYGPGTHPSDSNAISHSRIFALAGTTLSAAPLFAAIPGPGSTEFMEQLAFQTPQTWASNDQGNGQNNGAGGPDWSVGGGPSGTSPVSIINLRLLDNWAGGETNPNIYWKITNPAGAPTPASIFVELAPGSGIPQLFDQGYFFWSATPSNSFQRPFSWDDTFFPGVGSFTVPAPGSQAIGAINTVREGNQFLPANLDSLWLALFPVAALSNGLPFTGSDDLSLDGPVLDTAMGANTQLFEGVFSEIISGVSGLGVPLPIVGAADPTLVGLRIGIGAVTVQIDFGATPLLLRVAEIGSALTVTFQP